MPTGLCPLWGKLNLKAPDYQTTQSVVLACSAVPSEGFLPASCPAPCSTQRHLTDTHRCWRFQIIESLLVRQRNQTGKQTVWTDRLRLNISSRVQMCFTVTGSAKCHPVQRLRLEVSRGRCEKRSGADRGPIRPLALKCCSSELLISCNFHIQSGWNVCFQASVVSILSV